MILSAGASLGYAPARIAHSFPLHGCSPRLSSSRSDRILSDRPSALNASDVPETTSTAAADSSVPPSACESSTSSQSVKDVPASTTAPINARKRKSDPMSFGKMHRSSPRQKKLRTSRAENVNLDE
jgi:hypothetical protein